MTPIARLTCSLMRSVARGVRRGPSIRSCSRCFVKTIDIVAPTCSGGVCGHSGAAGRLVACAADRGEPTMVLERERRGRVEILTMNRPEARNAVSPEVSQAIEAALDELEADREVRVIVLTGNGPVFCAGADLKVVARGEGMNIETERAGF